ncbi:MAG: 7-carboxy-7-deazaguanine synthase [Hyphomonadaceae bacterium]|nr:7-carboxy-7-deazaguanine synthase [Hyphomonadaceae bacterium]
MPGVRITRAGLGDVAGCAVTYSVKECFYTLQGEGVQTGRAAVFLRFAGCNLWSGLERDRAHAVCKFCDTDFVGVDGDGGGKFATPWAMAEHVAARWRGEAGKPYVVCTGGEPLLQLDDELIAALQSRGFEVAVETNGTVAAPKLLDWVCVSPKSTAELKQVSGDELKLVYPQADAMPERFAGLAFRNFFLQPMDGPAREANTASCIAYCLEHPQWRLSLQTHKVTGIP